MGNPSKEKVAVYCPQCGTKYSVWESLTCPNCGKPTPLKEQGIPSKEKITVTPEEEENHKEKTVIRKLLPLWIFIGVNVAVIIAIAIGADTQDWSGRMVLVLGGGALFVFDLVCLIAWKLDAYRARRK